MAVNIINVNVKYSKFLEDESDIYECKSSNPVVFNLQPRSLNVNESSSVRGVFLEFNSLNVASGSTMTSESFIKSVIILFTESLSTLL